MTKELETLLIEVEQSLNDWIFQYAAAFCAPNQVAATRKRIEVNGGTLAYVTAMREKVSAFRKRESVETKS